MFAVPISKFYFKFHPFFFIYKINFLASNRFQKGAVPGSLNLPLQSCWTEDGVLLPCDQVDQLNKARGKIVCVVGSSSNNLALKFAEVLLDCNWPRVTILHKGFDVLLKTQILVVPAAVGMC